MKFLLHALTLLVLAAGSHAFALQDPGAAAGSESRLGDLSHSAREELERSTQALAGLRERIDKEKLPLAQELTAAEETLTRLRRQHESLTRQVDQASLDAPALERAIKSRQDELSYLSGLLDEYARSVESRLNVCEQQSFGGSVARAKQISSDPSLDAASRFEQQLEFVGFSVQRLYDALGGERFPGVGVDLQGSVLNGTFVLMGPVALFRAAGGGIAGLVVPQTGSDKPLIRPLEGAAQAGIAALVDGGEGFLPLDPSRGGALKALVQKTNLLHIFEKGGPIMWPLLIASILALGTVIERLVFLLRENLKRDPAALESFFAAVARGDLEEAARRGNESKFYLVRALAYALGHREQSLANALFFAQAQEMKRYRRGISILDTVITLAPLLGLLGTVVGMMGSFSLIGGDLSAPGAITGGIAEALIATAFGLGIAITSLLPFNFLNTKMDDARQEIESAATQMELMLQAPPTVVKHTTHVTPKLQPA